MLNYRTFLFSLLFCFITLVSGNATPRPDNDAIKTTDTLTIAVADFSGADKELGRFLSETLLTSLAQSAKLHLVERTEIRQALSELKLQSTGLFEPQQVKKLGKLVSADRLIVGSYLVHDRQIILNARLLDVKSGRLAPGGAANVSGNRDDILALTTRLARQFHKRVTGEDLALETSAEEPKTRHAKVTKQQPKEPEFTADNGETNPVENEDSMALLRRKHLLPSGARPNDIVLERDLTDLVTRIGRERTTRTPNPVTGTKPNAPVTRIRILTALIKLVTLPETIAQYRTETPQVTVPDAMQTPSWGLPYVYAALAEGWLSPEKPLYARQSATWAFVASLVAEMSLSKSAPAPVRQVRPAPAPQIAADEPDPDAFTGLVIEAYDCSVERTMSPRIVDERGRLVYPDPKNLPDYDFMIDRGMASYCPTIRDTMRAGKRPLVVRAIDVTGSLKCDLVVSNETAERIRAANRRDKFFSRWAVCILSNP